MGKTILFADGVFIGGTAAVQVAQELRGHFLQQGYLADQFENSPYTIGFVEAHGLALLIGISFLLNAKGTQLRFWHGLAVAVHVLLGTANLIFWPSFVAFDFVIQGVIATSLHAVFALANLYARRKAAAC